MKHVTIFSMMSLLLLAGNAFAFGPLFLARIDYGAGENPRSVFAVDLDGDGDNDLAVANSGSRNVSALLNNGDGTCQEAVDYGVGIGPTSVFAVDLDGDGDNDLAVANSYSDNVSVLLNNGDGMFQQAVNYEAGDKPYSVFAVDVDGDGDNDLAVANMGSYPDYSGSVSILLNSGDGTFPVPVNYGAGDHPSSVFAVDFDGDGDNDLAVTNSYSDNVSVLLNNGDGTFQQPVNYGVGEEPSEVFAVDLNGDGDNDLAVANMGSYPDYSGSVSILLNSGDGTFQEAVNYGVGNHPRSVFAVDFDGDGDNDLAVASIGPYPSFSGTVSILLNNGDGTFQQAVNYWAARWPASVFAADLDGDGDNDLAVGNTGDEHFHFGNVSVFLNNGDGTFQVAVNYEAAIYPNSVFAVDFDDDGDNDLAVTNSWSDVVSVLLNSGDGTFQQPVNYGVGEEPSEVFVADLDGDGDNDLAVANTGPYPSFSGTVSILLNNGDGTFQQAVNYEAGVGPRSVFAADLDGDGDNDLAVANIGPYPNFSGTVSILLNNGDGTFQVAVNYEAAIYPNSVFAVDFDDDGDNDLAVTNSWSDVVSVLLNSGDGTFQQPVNYGVGEEPSEVFAADLDGDGDNDLAVANWGGLSASGNVSVLLNNGDGTFQQAVNYAPGHGPSSVFAIDLDGDGDNDLAVVNSATNNVSVLLNNGDGMFQEAVSYGAGDWPTSVFAVDLDGDGDNDLAVANYHSDDVSILINLSGTTGIDNPPQTSLPESFSISQNYPNPFNASTTISYSLPEQSEVTIDIYDPLGRKVKMLMDGEQPAGYHKVVWDAREKSSGIYFARITAGDETAVIRMALLK